MSSTDIHETSQTLRSQNRDDVAFPIYVTFRHVYDKTFRTVRRTGYEDSSSFVSWLKDCIFFTALRPNLISIEPIEGVP